MTLPSKNIASVAPLVGVILLGWIVELFGLFYLQKSCRHHATPAWATAAGFPAVSSCWKLYRFEWLTIFFEFVIVLGLLFSLTSKRPSLPAPGVLPGTSRVHRHSACVCSCLTHSSACTLIDSHSYRLGMLLLANGAVGYKHALILLQRLMPSGDSVCHSWGYWPSTQFFTSLPPTALSIFKTLFQLAPS